MSFDSYLRFIVLIAALAGLAWHALGYRSGRYRVAGGEILRAMDPREFVIESVQVALMLAFAIAASLAGGRWFDALIPFLIAWLCAAAVLRAHRTGATRTLNGTVRRNEDPARYRKWVAVTAALALLSAINGLLRFFTYG